MREEDIVDPRVVPRWVPVGVSGVPRSREWDALTIVELPQLEGRPLEEIVFVRLVDGTTDSFGQDVPLDVIERLAAALEGSLEAPYEARAARRGTREWSLAARSVNVDLITLPAALAADEVTLAVGPDGSTTLLVDGEEPASVSAELATAAEVLGRQGRARSEAFVARAERAGSGRWTVTVDPL
jgi:hypothetical protein